MDLKLFFDPTEINVDESSSSFQSSVYTHRERMPDHEGLDIALIGLSEYRGSSVPLPNTESSDEARKQLYTLKKNLGDYGVIDLGNFRNGPQLEDTYLRLKEVCAYLMDEGIIPLLFGGSHDLNIGQFYAYENSEKLVSMIGVDQRVDLEDEGPRDSTHLNKIFGHNPNYLFNYCQLAHQSYLTNRKDLELIERLSFEAVRLGTLKENIKEVEPLVRDADLLSFDLNALQDFYAPGARDSKVYGLTGEEACQICWYAGQNEKLSSMGIYNYDSNQDTKDRKTAFVLSTMIWYFIEGFYHRKEDKNFTNDYMLYEVHLGGEPESIRFFKSIRSEKWWVELPNPEGNGLFNRNRMIACNYKDYKRAQSGEVPERWMNFLYKS